VRRLKGSLSTSHPIAGSELRAIKRYFATREDKLPWLFISERGQPMTRQAVNYIMRVAGEKAKLERVWPHMLRHSCRFYLARQGHRYVGHAGLSRAQGPEAHGALHAGGWARVRRSLALVLTPAPLLRPLVQKRGASMGRLAGCVRRCGEGVRGSIAPSRSHGATHDQFTILNGSPRSTRRRSATWEAPDDIGGAKRLQGAGNVS